MAGGLEDERCRAVVEARTARERHRGEHWFQELGAFFQGLQAALRQKPSFERRGRFFVAIGCREKVLNVANRFLIVLVFGGSEAVSTAPGEATQQRRTDFKLRTLAHPSL